MKSSETTKTTKRIPLTIPFSRIKKAAAILEIPATILAEKLVSAGAKIAKDKP